LPLGVLFLLPFAGALLFILPDLAHGQGYRDLLEHPQAWGALRLTLFTGVSATLLSLLFALLIIAGSRGNLAVAAGAFLAVPHLALAIGLAFLIMPSGLLARLVAVAAGWTTPPQWVTTQDPWGLALIAALVLKETPFLVWVFAGLLNRDDLQRQFAGHTSVARSLGHGPASTFLRVLLPQLLPRTIVPLIAVFTYGMTVVDMALVIGPGQPPTLAQLAWTDLNDADPATSARGAAGVLTLSGLILILLVVVGLLRRLARPWAGGFYSSYPRPGKPGLAVSGQIWDLWQAVYALIGILLLIQSLSGFWPFPDPMPQHLSVKAWSQLLANGSAFSASLFLALATASVAFVSVVAWLETQAPSRDRFIIITAILGLCLPVLLVALGQYRMFLWLGITGTPAALFLAHVLPVMAYVVVMLSGPYRAFDPRWQATASGLRSPRLLFLARVKWPMLKAPLLAAFAVGFAVSIMQFVPAQLAAAGRYSTLPMEAVTLSAGGNRALIAASGLSLVALPLVVFLLAGWFGRPRWRAS
jgi:putative thiamine transport system permease protein